MTAQKNRVRRSAEALAVGFFMLGFASSSWLSRLPAVRDALGLAPSTIGMMLLIGSLGSLVALPSAGPLIGRFGPRIVGRAGVLIWGLGLLGVVYALYLLSLSLTMACLVALSCGISFWASSINTAGGLTEVLLRSVLLDKLHAMYSIGTVAGALVGAGLARIDLSLSLHFIGIVVLVWVSMALATHFFLSENDVLSARAPSASTSGELKGRTKRAWTEKTTLLIALMVMSAGLLEGSANDWLTLAMVDGYNFSGAEASAVLSLFLLVMATMRLSSTRLHRRFAPDVLLRTLLIAACIGVVCVALGASALVALVGVVLWGMGAALIYPTASSALAKDPVMTAARASVLATVNYSAYLVGPPVLGVLAEHLGYHRALIFLLIPVSIGIFLTRYLRQTEKLAPPRDLPDGGVAAHPSDAS